VDLRTVWRPEQRRDVVARLRAKRWSTTRIAEAIGVSDETVRQDLSISNNLEIENPSRIDRLGGGTYPSSLPAPAQIADRRDRAQELRDWLCRWSPGCLAEPNLEPWSAQVREPSPIQFGWQAAWPET
jgi:hypothetical protein